MYKISQELWQGCPQVFRLGEELPLVNLALQIYKLFQKKTIFNLTFLYFLLYIYNKHW